MNPPRFDLAVRPPSPRNATTILNQADMPHGWVLSASGRGNRVRTIGVYCSTHLVDRVCGWVALYGRKR